MNNLFLLFARDEDGWICLAVVVIGIAVWWNISEWNKKESIKDAARKSRQERERKQREELRIARERYEEALAALEEEDCNKNRIHALESGREYCAVSRKVASGDKAVTAVDEQMITNDINARTCG